ncbi:MAG TPA: hypothetical protein PK515_03525, partial [Candidatus Cloacimonas sp.]|nr:hypothetical protein [Candidatus Cloacimonas sp.]
INIYLYDIPEGSPVTIGSDVVEITGGGANIVTGDIPPVIIMLLLPQAILFWIFLVLDPGTLKFKPLPYGEHIILKVHGIPVLIAREK